MRWMNRGVLIGFALLIGFIDAAEALDQISPRKIYSRREDITSADKNADMRFFVDRINEIIVKFPGDSLKVDHGFFLSLRSLTGTDLAVLGNLSQNAAPTLGDHLTNKTYVDDHDHADRLLPENPTEGQIPKFLSGRWTNAADATGGGGGGPQLSDLAPLPVGGTNSPGAGAQAARYNHRHALDATGGNTLPIGRGGTGATSATAARNALGLGTGNSVTFGSINAGRSVFTSTLNGTSALFSGTVQVATPTANGHAATKGYVDENSGSSSFKGTWAAGAYEKGDQVDYNAKFYIRKASGTDQSADNPSTNTADWQLLGDAADTDDDGLTDDFDDVPLTAFSQMNFTASGGRFVAYASASSYGTVTTILEAGSGDEKCQALRYCFNRGYNVVLSWTTETRGTDGSVRSFHSLNCTDGRNPMRWAYPLSPSTRRNYSRFTSMNCGKVNI